MNCLLAGWCGDAAGAVLEFMRSEEITPSSIQEALRMPGGGVFKVGPGQITDDSELELAILNAVRSHDPHDGYPIDDVAANYISWIESAPFDIGRTCYKAFNNAKNASDMMKNASSLNMNTESNGALMRAAGLAVWASTMPVNVVAQYAKQDALFSHPNPYCVECNKLFCCAISLLLKQQKVTIEEKASKVYDWVYRNARLTKEWLDEPMDSLVASVNIGHVKHAFRLAIHHMKHMTSYEDAMFDVLIRGGDTDTNAKIVMNILGALYNNDPNHKLPNYMVGPVLTFDCTKVAPSQGRRRPSLFGVKYFVSSQIQDKKKAKKQEDS